MSRIARTRLLLILLATAACAGKQAENTGPAAAARARIENHTIYDMDIYIHRQPGAVSRLGFLPASETADFALPRVMVAGSATVRFEARPVRGAGRRVMSEPFGVHGGDELVWSIPPQ